MELFVDNQYAVLIPALVPLAYLVGGLVVFAVLCAVGRRPSAPQHKETEQLGTLSVYLHWMLRPAERFAVRARVSPNAMTWGSAACACAAGAMLATGHFALATWSFVLAGIFDLMDGRIARLTGRQTRSGAFLDSVLDRWGELFVYSGLAWQLQGSWAMGAALAALGGAFMVSYTRARGEALGVTIAGGAMQRPERLLLTVVGLLFAAVFDADPTLRGYVPAILGTTASIVGALSIMTAAGRLRAGYRMLDGKAPHPRAPAETYADGAPVRQGAVARVLRIGRAAPGDRAANG